ncbi:MAG: alpha/beta fold hydrolase BchO [Pseudomonadota bacterium]
MSGTPHRDWDSDGADWPNREASMFLHAGGIEWHVQRMGAGPVALLLHGSGAATNSWAELLPLLAQDFDVVAPDLPGHGFSRAPSRRMLSLPAMADEVTALTETLEIAPDLVIGHSAGAAIALRTVLSGALTPRMVIGLNAALTPFRGLAGIMFPPMAKLLAMNPFTPWMFSQVAGSEQTAKRLIEGTGSRIDPAGLALYARLLARPDHVGGALSMMAQWDLEPLLRALPHIRVPLHLVVGLQDKAVPPGEAAALAQANPMITLHEFVDAGHLLHEEYAEETHALIKRLVTPS